MADEFESAEHLADWAKEEAVEFERLSKAFLDDRETIAFVGEFDPQTGQRDLKIKLMKPMPPRLRGLASNTIKNMRDSLDQAVYAATAVIRGEGNKRCHFPFGESPDDLENCLSLRKSFQCKGIPPELYPVLRSFEPYPTGQGYTGGNDPLRILGRVSGPHKHSVTLAIGAIADGATFTPRGSVGDLKIYNPIWNTAKNELKLMSVSPDSELQVDVEVPVYIAFHTAPLRNQNVPEYLRMMSDFVRRAVETLKSESFKIAGRG